MVELAMERPLSALVVDPNEPIRVLLIAFLARCGFAVDSADGVESAIAKLRCSDFSVLIIDRESGSNGVDGIAQICDEFPGVSDHSIVLTSPPARPLSRDVHTSLIKPFELD